MLVDAIALSNGLHLVSPESSFISSTSATSISGLWDGEEVTDIALGDEDSKAVEFSGVKESSSFSRLPLVGGIQLISVERRVGEGFPKGSRTLMVTLLGVRAIGGRPLLSLESGDEACSFTAASGAWARSTPEEAVLAGSADMLRYTRSPLSKRGRFLVLEKSASSIGCVRGVEGPADCEEVGVGDCRIKPESMTW